MLFLIICSILVETHLRGGVLLVVEMDVGLSMRWISYILFQGRIGINAEEQHC